MPAINNGRNHFDVLTYTGTGATQTISGLNFQPDFVWIKSRSAATDHKLTDSVRGVTKGLISDSTAAESTDINGLTTFNSNGFTLGSDSVYNSNGATYVAWCWKAGGTAVTNTSGTITSQVSANPTAGFSVVTYMGNGTAGATVGHGLGVKPALIIAKYRGGISSWPVYHQSLGATKWILLNSTSAVTTSSQEWNNTEPTSSVFSIGNSSANDNQSGLNVAYCFSEIAGYSAFGSYTGNGSDAGPFVWTGFLPRFVLIKLTSGIGGDWIIWDSSRNPYNVIGNYLYADSSAAEGSGSGMNFLSNGIKISNDTGGGINGSGSTYIYAAFAENPFKYSLAR